MHNHRTKRVGLEGQAPGVAADREGKKGRSKSTSIRNMKEHTIAVALGCSLAALVIGFLFGFRWTTDLIGARPISTEVSCESAPGNSGECRAFPQPASTVTQPGQQCLRWITAYMIIRPTGYASVQDRDMQTFMWPSKTSAQDAIVDTPTFEGYQIQQMGLFKNSAQ